MLFLKKRNIAALITINVTIPLKIRMKWQRN